MQNIVSLTPLDVGFDVRLHDIKVILSESVEGLKIDVKGKDKIITGNQKKLISEAKKAGYKIEFANKYKKGGKKTNE